MGIHSYKDAGVDIKKGDAFASFISNIKSPAVSTGLGGFAGSVELDLSEYTQPLLFSATDGVGTKLLVAKHLNDYSTIGIDLVAMCVNDLIVCGAIPLTFLDYIACGSINKHLLSEVIQGIVRGCELAGCTLAGGETAEMPDMYDQSDIDLAGFCTGIAEKDDVLPKIGEMRKGDRVMGLASAGIHSNGLSLARKAVTPDSPVYKELLIPTKIYVSELEVLLGTGKILGAAHITGGGLYNNIRRVTPETSSLNLFWDWPVPEIFSEISRLGEVKEEEMRLVFNMGIGIGLIIHPEDTDEVSRIAGEKSIDLLSIGEIG